MDPNRLDDLAKVVASTSSRRQALKAFGASALAFMFAGIRGGGAEAHHDAPCRDDGDNCRSNAECCSRVCLDFHCGCPEGQLACQGECVAQCRPPKVLNPLTCTCDCPPDFSQCGDTCCGPDQVCRQGQCVAANLCAPAAGCGLTPQCGSDPSCICFSTVEGLGFCHRVQSCSGLQECTTSLDCPPDHPACVVTCCGPQAVCIQPCVPGLQAIGLSSDGPTTGGRR
jgi:hypothetical protein